MADAENRRGNKEAAGKYSISAADSARNNDALFYQTLRAMINIMGQKNFEDYANAQLAQNPSSLPVLRVLYEIKLSAGEFEKAVETIDKCLVIAKNDPNIKIPLVIQKAGAYYSAYTKTNDKNYIKKAINEYESVLPEMPNNRKADIMNNLAYMLADADERLGDALNYAQQIYQVNPGNPDYLDTYAFVLLKNGKPSDAQQYIQSAIQLYITQQRTVPWNVYQRAGEIAEKNGSRFQAVSSYKQALQAGQGQMSDAEKALINAAIERLSKEK